MARERNDSLNDEVKEAKQMWEQGKDKAARMASNVKDEATELWEKSSKKVKDSAAKANEYAEDHPWQMAAAGAAVGFVVAALLFRRRD